MAARRGCDGRTRRGRRSRHEAGAHRPVRPAAPASRTDTRDVPDALQRAVSLGGRSSLDIRQPAMIRVVITGGTFDKEYNELNGTLFFKDTHIPEMLRLGRSMVDLRVHTLMMMD